MSRHMIQSVLRPSRSTLPSPEILLPLCRQRSPILSPRRRHLSSTHAEKPSKPIALEKPDRFRPPSHPSRLNARRIPLHYAGPPVPDAERAAQRTRQYPHMFPNEGTRMHWFLTNRWVHVWISLGTLFLLSVITLTQSFLATSPFAHLTPAISSLPTAPLSFVRDWLGVVRMHMQYETERAAAKRGEAIQDAQKRRLYRRAHGMEDLEKEGVGEGIDVRGLVAWDDGLTRGERERERERAGVGDDASPVSRNTAGEEEEEKRVRRPVKKWLGIW